MHQRRAEAHQLARPRHELEHERMQGLAVMAREQGCGIDAVTQAIRLGNVQAPVLRVAAEVLPEVGELQRGTDGVGAGQRIGVADFVKVEQEPADRVGRAATVVEQRRAIGVADRRHVLREGVEQIAEQADRETMPFDRQREWREHVGPARRRWPAGSSRKAARSARRSAGVASPSSAMSSAVRANE